MLQIFLYQYAEGSSYNKYIEIYNGTGSAVSLDNYKFRTTPNGNVTYWNEYFASGATIENSDTYVICDPQASQEIQDKCDYNQAQYFFNGNDTWELVTDYQSETSYKVIDVIGDGTDPGNGWSVCGISDGTKEHTLIKKDGIEGNTNWSNSAGTSAEDCDWIVKDQNDFNDLGVHTWNGSSNGGGTGGGGGGGGGEGAGNLGGGGAG